MKGRLFMHKLLFLPLIALGIIVLNFLVARALYGHPFLEIFMCLFISVAAADITVDRIFRG